MFWRLLFWLVDNGDPWYPDPTITVDLDSPTVRRLIARAIWNERRERGGMVAWTYSRDRVVERRELALESPEQKADRLVRARLDRGAAPTQDGEPNLRLVV